MGEQFQRTNETGPLSATRRETVRLGSGVALAALAGVLTGGRVLAQEASPAAEDGSAGQYMVIRYRKVKEEHSGEEVTARVESDFIPVLKEIPGFISYTILWNPETRDWASIGVFTDKTAADESTERAAEFGASSGTNELVEGPPVVIEGEISLAVSQDA